MSFKIIIDKKNNEYAINTNMIQSIDRTSKEKTIRITCLGVDGYPYRIIVEGDLKPFMQFLNSNEIEYKPNNI